MGSTLWLSLLSVPEAVALMASAPQDSRSWQILMPVSAWYPFWPMYSSMEMRNIRGKSGPQVSRIASVISRRTRVRFSRLPPYSSSRWLVTGLKKLWRK